MRLRALLPLLFFLITEVVWAGVQVNSITENSISLFLEENTAIENVDGPKNESFQLFCGENVIQVKDTLNEISSQITIPALCPLSSFAVSIIWTIAPGESTPLSVENHIADGSRIGLSIKARYRPCLSNSSYCSSSFPWYHLANQEFRQGHGECQWNKTSLEAILPQLNGFYNGVTKICSRRIILPLWEVVDKENREVIRLDENMSFVLGTSRNYIVRSKISTGWKRELKLDLNGPIAQWRQKRQAPTSPANWVVCNDTSTTTTTTTTSIMTQPPTTTSMSSTLANWTECKMLYLATLTTTMSTSTTTPMTTTNTSTSTTMMSSSTSTTTPATITTSTTSTSASTPTTMSATTAPSTTTSTMSTSTNTSTSSTSPMTTSTSTRTHSTTSTTSTLSSTIVPSTTTTSSSTSTTTPATTSTSTTTPSTTSTSTTTSSSTSTTTTSTSTSTSPTMTSTMSANTTIPSITSTMTSTNTSTNTTTPSITTTSTTPSAMTSSSTTAISPTITTPGVPLFIQTTTSTSTMSSSTSITTPKSTSIMSTTSTSISTSTTPSTTRTSTSTSTITPSTTTMRSSTKMTTPTTTSTTTTTSTSSTSFTSTTSPSTSTSSTTTSTTLSTTSSMMTSTTSPRTTSTMTNPGTSISAGSITITEGESSMSETTEILTSSTSTSAATSGMESSTGTSSTITSIDSTSTAETNTQSPTPSIGTTSSTETSTTVGNTTSSTTSSTGTSTTSTMTGSTESSSTTTSTSSTTSSTTEETSTSGGSSSSSTEGISSSTIQQSTTSPSIETTTLGENSMDCFVTSSSLNISTIQQAPSEIMGDAYVKASLTNTGTCNLITWNIDGIDSQGGRIKRETLTPGTHTVCAQVGSQEVGCGYIEVVTDVAWTNKCEDVSISAYLTDSVTITTPLNPETVAPNYNWDCNRIDSATCYTMIGERMSKQGTITFSPIQQFLNSFGNYLFTGNVSDPETGSWSCRRYSLNVIPETTERIISTLSTSSQGTTSAKSSTSPSSTSTTTSSEQITVTTSGPKSASPISSVTETTGISSNSTSIAGTSPSSITTTKGQSSTSTGTTTRTQTSTSSTSIESTATTGMESSKTTLGTITSTGSTGGISTTRELTTGQTFTPSSLTSQRTITGRQETTINQGTSTGSQETTSRQSTGGTTESTITDTKGTTTAGYRFVTEKFTSSGITTEAITSTLGQNESTGSCVRLTWKVDGISSEGGTIKNLGGLTAGKHEICYYFEAHLLGCGYIRVLTDVNFTNSCDSSDLLIHMNETLVLTTPAVPTSSVTYNWNCSKTGGESCYTSSGNLMKMQDIVILMPVGSFLNGRGSYLLTAMVKDSNNMARFSCRIFNLTVVEWQISTSSSTNMTSSSSSSSSTSLSTERTSTTSSPSPTSQDPNATLIWDNFTITSGSFERANMTQGTVLSTEGNSLITDGNSTGASTESTFLSSTSSTSGATIISIDNGTTTGMTGTSTQSSTGNIETTISSTDGTTTTSTKRNSSTASSSNETKEGTNIVTSPTASSSVTTRDPEMNKSTTSGDSTTSGSTVTGTTTEKVDFGEETSTENEITSETFFTPPENENGTISLETSTETTSSVSSNITLGSNITTSTGIITTLGTWTTTFDENRNQTTSETIERITTTYGWTESGNETNGTTIFFTFPTTLMQTITNGNDTADKTMVTSSTASTVTGSSLVPTSNETESTGTTMDSSTASTNLTTNGTMIGTGYLDTTSTETSTTETTSPDNGIAVTTGSSEETTTTGTETTSTGRTEITGTSFTGETMETDSTGATTTRTLTTGTNPTDDGNWTTTGTEGIETLTTRTTIGRSERNGTTTDTITTIGGRVNGTFTTTSVPSGVGTTNGTTNGSTKIETTGSTDGGNETTGSSTVANSQVLTTTESISTEMIGRTESPVGNRLTSTPSNISSSTVMTLDTTTLERTSTGTTTDPGGTDSTDGENENGTTSTSSTSSFGITGTEPTTVTGSTTGTTEPTEKPIILNPNGEEKRRTSNTTDGTTLEITSIKTTTKSVPTMTEIPAMMTPELEKKINNILGIIDDISDLSAIKVQCAENTSELAMQYNNLTTAELKFVAKELTNGSLTSSETYTNGSAVISALQNSMDCLNNELAQRINGIIQDLSQLPIDSPASLKIALKTLMDVLSNSISSSLRNSRDQTLQGTFIVLYGTIEANNYTLAATRSTVRIVGPNAHISGDIRPAFIQRGDATLDISDPYNLGYHGEFIGNTGLIVEPGASVVRPLSADRLYARIESPVANSAGDLTPDLFILVWNITKDVYGSNAQDQIDTAVSFWVTVQSGSIRMDGSQALNMAPLPAISLEVQALINGEIFTISAGSGMVQVIENRGTDCIIQYDSTQVTVDPREKSVLDQIQFPLVLENLDCSALQSAKSSIPSSLLQGNKRSPMGLVVPHPGSYEPPVLPITTTFKNVILPFGEVGTSSQLNQKMAQGLPILILGSIQTSREIITFASGDTVQFTGSFMLFTYSSGKSKAQLLSPSWKVDIIDGKVSLIITSCTYKNPTQPHVVTQVEVSTTATIYLTGGTIIRNGSHEYVISNAAINYTGLLPPGAVDLEPQSLLIQASQSLVIGILKDTASYLRSNGSQMTMAQLNETASNLLIMSGRIIQTMISSLNNPLSSDLFKNLQFEKDNYNDLFNVLPDNAGDIRYVEEYTEQEWAQQATKIAQQAIARAMAAQLADTMAALGDAFASKLMSQAPYSISLSAGGGTIVESGGNESSLLSQTYSCNNWTVTFPPNLTDLNIFSIRPTDKFRVSLFCFDLNPYAYADNYASLVTSGTVDISLKTVDAQLINVTEAKKPIEINGLSQRVVDFGIQVVPDAFKDIEILNVRTFHTTAWNYSIVLEVSFIDLSLPERSEIYVFVSFQGLPGPMPKDHDFRFLIKDTTTVTTLFVDSRNLRNSSGLYYVGIGVRLTEATETTANYIIDGEEWHFSHDPVMEYSIRALTKGCYFFNVPNDHFDSENISVPLLLGDQRVLCHSYHLTSFSIGLMSSEFSVDFDYKYVMDVKHLMAGPLLLLIFTAVLLLFPMVHFYRIREKELCCGRLRKLRDNEEMDRYIYIMSVETGFQMFASTCSQFNFNLTGTEGQTIARSFEWEECDYEEPFKWGRIARFVLKTRWPLGELTYLRIWISKPGLDYTESWYCNRVVIKDIQLNKYYYFPINNWFGSNAADGKTERLAEAVPKDKRLQAACALHMLSYTLAYFACFTGGSGYAKVRISRYERFAILLFTLLLAMYANGIILKNVVYHSSPSNILGIPIDYWDIIFGVSTGLFITFFGWIIPLFKHDMLTRLEMWEVAAIREKNKNFKAGNILSSRRFFQIPRPDKFSFIPELLGSAISPVIFMTIVIALVLLGDMPQDNADAFLRRILLGILLWFIFFEPVKAILWGWSILRNRPDFNIIFPLEQALLPTLPIHTFPKPNPQLQKHNVGTNYADLCQLAATQQARVREDRLFHTMKEVLLLLAAMFIFLGLSNLSKDSSGFYYQSQLRTTLNVDPPSKNLPFDRTLSWLELRNANDFWKWANDSLANGIRPTWYDDQPAWSMRGFLDDKVSRAMGNGVIRQVRSAPMPCPNERYYTNCLYNIDISGVEKESFGNSWLIDNETTTEFSYRSSQNLMNQDVDGEFESYKGGGYAIGLGGTTTELQEKLTLMKELGWIDKYTRAVIVEFSVYNAQINYFAVVQLLLEMPQGRMSITSAWIEPIRLIKYEGSTGTATMVFEFMFIAYAFVMFFKETITFLSCRYRRIQREKFPWNPLRWPEYFFYG